MATRSELYPSNWLGAADCRTPIVVTIDRCTIETVGQGAKAERKPVLRFAGGALKPFIVNKTNYDAIASIAAAEDTDEWGGTVIELFAIDVMGPNGPTRGVRVRKPRRATKAPVRVLDQVDESMPTVADVEY
jgi:hypothetical protein